MIYRSLIFSLLITLTFFSCETAKESWADKIISAEKDLVMVTSVDLFNLIKKVDMGSNDQLSIDQKMMYKAFMSSFNNSSFGFNVEQKHRLFIVPQEGKLNAGVFLAGDVLDYNVFQTFLTNYFGVSSFSGSQPTTCYLEEYKIFVGFNEHSFVAGFSANKLYLESKIESFFNKQKSKVNNPYLKEYLFQNDDLSCYLSTEKLIAFFEGVNNPILKMQMPNLDQLKQFGSSLKMAMNFNNGNCSLSVNSNFSNAENKQLYSSEGVEDKYRTFLTDNDKLILFGLLNMVTDNVDNQLDQLQRLGLLNEFNEVLENFGTSSNELLSIIDGQMAFSLIDFPQKNKDDLSNDKVYNEQDDEYWDDEFEDTELSQDESSNLNLPTLLISIGNKDTQAMNKLLNQNNIPVVNDSVINLDLGIYLLSKNQVLHVSTNEELINKIADKGGLNTYSKIDQSSFKKPLYGGVNLDLNKWPKEISDELFKNTDSELIFDEIDNVIITANNNEGLIRVNMTNTNQNSLKTIMDIILQKRLIENFI